jgi:hypothetical protein
MLATTAGVSSVEALSEMINSKSGFVWFKAELIASRKNAARL